MSQVKSSGGKGIEISLSWQEATNGHIPKNSVSAGDSYIARAVYNGEYIPGKVVAGQNSAHICYGGEEIPVYEYQVLVDTQILGEKGYEWKSCNGSDVPKGAIVGGSDKKKPLYIGRAKVDGSLSAGKFLPEFGCTYIPYGCKEHAKSDSEILCFSKINV